MKINTSVALKAGLIGAAAGVVFGIIAAIVPGVDCLLGWWVPAAIGLVTGGLYVYLTPGKEDIAGGAVGGAVTGAVAGLAKEFASNLLDLLLGDGTILGLLGGIVLGAIVGAILGAIGGAVYAAIKK
jgi:hypothetical protein